MSNPLRAWLARPITRGLLVVLGLVVALTAVVFNTTSPLSPDRQDRFETVDGLTPIDPSERIEQRFVALADGLSTVQLRFGTYQGESTDCTLDVAVTEVGGPVVERSRIDCAALTDLQLRAVARFAPIEDSQGTPYRVSVTSRPGSDDPLTLFGGVSPDLPGAEHGGERIEESVEVRTRYGEPPGVLDRLSTFLRRIGQYRPPWGQGPAVVAQIVAAVALVGALVAVPRRHALVVLLVLAAVKGVLWTVVLPPLESPDEPAHYAYAQYLAEERAVPRRDDDPGRGYSPELRRAIEVLNHGVPREGDRPPFGPGSEGAASDAFDGNLSTEASGGGPSAGYTPAYYGPTAVLYHLSPDNLLTRVSVMRLWSVALGVLSVFLAWLVGRRLFPESSGAALGLATAVALQPLYSQQMASINNDALVIAGGFGCLLVALELIRPAPTRLLLFAAGGILGLTLLGKPYGIAFISVLAGAWVLGRLRHRDRAASGWLADVGLAGAGLAATYGLWLVVAVLFDFPPTSLAAVDPAPGPRGARGYLRLVTEDGGGHLSDLWVDRFWGTLSYTDTPFPGWVNAVLTMLTLTALVGVAVWGAVVVARGVRRRHPVAPWHWPDHDVGILVCLATVASTLAVLHAIEYQDFRGSGRLAILQGRYALMALPAVLALPVLLLRRLAPGVPVGASAAAVAGGVAVLQVIGLALLVPRFYL